MSEKVLGLIAGKSTMGKTTLAGTLPGNTLLLQVRKKERGANSAVLKAEQLGRGKVTVEQLSTPEQFLKRAKELVKDKTYDNIYVDGFSALTFLVGEDPDIRAIIEQKRGNSSWAGFDRIKARNVEIHEAFAELTYDDVCEHSKNVFFTVAIEIGADGNGQAKVNPIMKGQASYQEFTRPSPTIITLVQQQNEDGTTERVMLTKDTGPYLGRVQNLLDDDNPGIMPADLNLLLALINKGNSNNGK